MQTVPSPGVTVKGMNPPRVMRLISIPLLLSLSLVLGADRSDPVNTALRTREYVGSTPGARIVREFLRIPNNVACDKVQWRLRFLETATSTNYHLSVSYGLQESSAPGFVSGGTTVELHGRAELSHPDSGERRHRTIFRSDPPGSLSFAVINDDLVHVVDSSKRLLIGNEFWSYTLNREGAGRPR